MDAVTPEVSEIDSVLAAGWLLELVDADGRVLERRSIANGESIEIGRGYQVDLIHDDPHLCPRHARVEAGAAGWRVENLSGVNGVVDGSGERVETSAGRVSATFRLGPLGLRIHPRDTELPEALPYRFTHGSGSGWPWPSSAMAFAGVLGILAWESWINSVYYTKWEEAVIAIVGFATLIAMWAGLWSLASRILRKRSYFLDHILIVSTAMMVGWAWETLVAWLVFWSGAGGDTAILDLLVGGAILAAMFHFHRTRVSLRPRKWVAACVGFTIVAVGLVSYYAERDDFSSFPSHPSTIKPVPASLLPTKPLEDFLASAEEIREALDEDVHEARLEEDRGRSNRRGEPVGSDG